MLLKDLVCGVECRSVSGPEVEIGSLGHNSKIITENMLFFCIKGTRLDGHDYAADAVAHGAVAIVVERLLPIKIPQVLVRDCRKAMAAIAGNFYGNAHNRMKIIGITGTNGKTTTTFIIRSIAEFAGLKTGLIGTSGIIVDGKIFPPILTTPDPIDLHRIFKDMADAGVQLVVMEVSAHALDLGKMDGIILDIATFSNLSQDHLDYFGNMEKYKAAKKKLFCSGYAKAAYVNIDDECGREIAAEADIPVYTYGTENPADVFAVNYNASSDGLSYVLNCFDELADISFRLPGKFNMFNTMAAAGACRLLDIPIEAVESGIKGLSKVPGRFNVIDCGKGYSVIIDYAHTPDGLKNILSAIREFTKGRIITVFGCGGNRDRKKRAPMGWIVAKNSSYTIITSDNPRYEEPMDIIQEIELGVRAANGARFAAIESRREAIRYAMRVAAKGDVILIAGKGDEPYQEIMGEKLPYSDIETVYGLIKERDALV